MSINKDDWLLITLFWDNISSILVWPYVLVIMCQSRSSVQAENGFAHGLMPKISGGRHELRESPTNMIGDALEIEDGKRDGISSAKVLSICVCV